MRTRLVAFQAFRTRLLSSLMPPIHLLLTPAHLTAEGFRLDGDQYHHLVRVRRVQLGDALQAALPDGRLLQARVTEITPTALHARVDQTTQAALLPCAFTLYLAVLKGEKMDFLVQKATELGVTTLVPVFAQRCVPRWTPAQAQERTRRWTRIAESAATQAERVLPPQVTFPQPLAACLTGPGLGLLLHERDGVSLRTLAAATPQPAAIRLFIGPEGGWTPEECALLRAHGILPIHLGQRILRAETAAIAALTLAQFLWGDLG